MSIAERVNWLFQHVRKSDDSEYTLAEVEQGIKEAGGSNVSASTLHKIRHGTIRNPGYLTLTAIAKFFGASITIFEEEELDASPIPSNDAQVQRIAWRAAELDGQSRTFLLHLIASLKHERSKEASADASSE